MNGIIIVSLSFITTVISQIDLYARRPVYPSTYDRPYIGGSHLGDSYAGTRPSSSSTSICRDFGEYAEHDSNGYVETCVSDRDCRGGYANCRRTRGASYGMCCTGRHPGGDQDVHCPDGQPSSGPCDLHPPYYYRCHNRHHYQCIRTTYRAGYRYPTRGICCRHRQHRPHPY